jgi:hypothetical protein
MAQAHAGGGHSATQAHMGGGHGAQGRPISWLSVLIICIGFTVGGIGLCLNPTWWLFWTGIGIIVVGGIMALACGIMEDYSCEEH